MMPSAKLISKHVFQLTSLFFISTGSAIAEDLHRSLSPFEKLQIATNVSSRCTINFKQQTTKLSNQYIQEACSCVGNQMAELLSPFDILEESQKNPNYVIDDTTNFRKIQKLSILRCANTNP